MAKTPEMPWRMFLLYTLIKSRKWMLNSQVANILLFQSKKKKRNFVSDCWEDVIDMIFQKAVNSEPTDSSHTFHVLM